MWDFASYGSSAAELVGQRQRVLLIQWASVLVLWSLKQVTVPLLKWEWNGPAFGPGTNR